MKSIKPGPAENIMMFGMRLPPRRSGADVRDNIVQNSVGRGSCRAALRKTIGSAGASPYRSVPNQYFSEDFWTSRTPDKEKKIMYYQGFTKNVFIICII
jgi:hypothetical protein